MRKIYFVVIAFAMQSTAFAKDNIPAGVYMELFYGAKSGGGKEHHSLVAKLKKDDVLQGFEFFCISGRSRSAANVPGYAVDRERRIPPTLAKNCKGSAAILMGPVQGENIEQLEKHLDSNYMHLYSDIRVIY